MDLNVFLQWHRQVMKSILSFPLTTFLATLLLFGTIVSAYYLLFAFNSDDIRDYWAVMEASDSSHGNEVVLPYTAKQQRHHIHKHLWINSAEENKEIAVRSEDAELVLDRHDEDTEVIEHMRNVQCYMQEELYYSLSDGREVVKKPNGSFYGRDGDPIDVGDGPLLPMQIIRYMEADAASYYYKSDQLIAEQVTLSRYAIPGHELVESLENMTPLMTGVAQSIECTLDGQDPQFKAHQIKAILHHSGT